MLHRVIPITCSWFLFRLMMLHVYIKPMIVNRIPSHGTCPWECQKIDGEMHLERNDSISGNTVQTNQRSVFMCIGFFNQLQPILITSSLNNQNVKSARLSTKQKLHIFIRQVNYLTDSHNPLFNFLPQTLHASNYLNIFLRLSKYLIAISIKIVSNLQI